ncbi:hypothetical protein F4680DRAFT_185377 [Xylaria scruposa]|nr:hypothetical protein F4680DRAFT_185377 [Xylaria scruposa]
MKKKSTYRKIDSIKEYYALKCKFDQRLDKIEELLRSLTSYKLPSVASSGVKSEPSEQAAYAQPLTLDRRPPNRIGTTAWSLRSLRT